MFLTSLMDGLKLLSILFLGTRVPQRFMLSIVRWYVLHPTDSIACFNALQCLTEDGKELTRVCLIDYFTGEVEYDQLVKPTKPITDYLTRYVLSRHGLLLL